MTMEKFLNSNEDSSGVAADTHSFIKCQGRNSHETLDENVNRLVARL